MGRYSSVIEALTDRINAHIAADGILDGWKFLETPEIEAHGMRDFPAVALFMPDMAEAEHGRIIADGSMTLKLTVSTKRKKDSSGLIEHYEAIEKVLDAIELAVGEDDETTLDLWLSATLVKPMVVSIRDPFPLEISLNSHLFISATPRPRARGNRRT
jgi:hypothetical protein